MELIEYPREYQPYIDRSPMAPDQMYAKSTANDSVTINSWRYDWLHNYRKNKERVGSFAEHSIGQLYRKHLHMPAVIIGSGPHLKRNAHLLTTEAAKSLVKVSCLHNFHYLEDLGVDVDYYVSLDAGPLTIDELSEGGNPEVDYWAKTADKTLLAYACSHPTLIEKWQGRILFFQAPVPDKDLTAELEKIEKFNTMVSNGGNVLGACLYIAKGYLGCDTIVFLGASFSFDSAQKFHAWDSKYDNKLGHCLRVPDIYGHKVKTWQSYYNFCNWFNYVAENVPGEYINATEGGVLGAYEKGNIRAIKQLDFKDVLDRFDMSSHVYEQAIDPKTSTVKILF